MQKILIAEDDVVLREAYVTILTHAGYQVVEAVDGRQALDVLEQEMPALIVLDMLMPGMTGMEVLQSPRLQKTRHQFRVIAFTNLSDPETLQALEELGVERYLLKSSITPHVLIEEVGKVLALPSQSKPPAAA